MLAHLSVPFCIRNTLLIFFSLLFKFRVRPHFIHLFNFVKIATINLTVTRTGVGIKLNVIIY